MGDLKWHIFTGITFAVCAIWWFIHMFQHYFRSKCKNQPPYKSQPWYSDKLCCNFPIESVMKVAVSSGGILGDVITYFYSTGPFTELDQAQHLTMYFFFGLNGAMDILKFYRFRCLPDGIETASGVMAFGAEAFLFYNHLHGRPSIDVQSHMFIFYAVVATILCIFLEVQYRNYIIPSLGRAYFTLLQGTWFFQVGFILYPPSPDMRWDLDDHEEMMAVTVIFMWHAIIDSLAALVIASVTWSYMKRCHQLDDVMYKRVNDATMHPMPDPAIVYVMHVDKTQQLLDSGTERV